MLLRSNAPVSPAWKHASRQSPALELVHNPHRIQLNTWRVTNLANLRDVPFNNTTNVHYRVTLMRIVSQNRVRLRTKSEPKIALWNGHTRNLSQKSAYYR